MKHQKLWNFLVAITLVLIAVNIDQINGRLNRQSEVNMSIANSLESITDILEHRHEHR